VIFSCFQIKKIVTAGKIFSSNAEMINAINDYFSGLNKSYYIEGIKGLEKRWIKCIELKGDVEKFAFVKKRMFFP